MVEIKNQERMMNSIMFGVWGVMLPIAACAFVILFLNGDVRDTVALGMIVLAVLIRIFERQLGIKAKYFYSCLMPVMGAVILIVDAEGRFAAMTQAYFLATVMSIIYYDKSVLITNAIATIFLNLVGIIFFTGAYTSLHNLVIWIFIVIVYTILVIALYLIIEYTNNLYKKVENQSKETENVLFNVKDAFNQLQEATANILGSLQEFEGNTKGVASSTEEITQSAERQIDEVEGSISIFETLDSKISSSEERVNQTVSTMKALKDKNDAGIVAIQNLSKTFEQNILTTKVASEGVEDLSHKSTSIGGIIESIREIANQTNLLALNAAIEAARAGEAGKGFAVVADEIKDLSSESSSATNKIDVILKDIIETVKNTHELINQNSEVVSTSNLQLKDTIQIFETILTSSDEVIETIKLLKDELMDIVGIKKQLLEAMQRVEKISQKSVATTSEISVAAEEQVAGVECIVKSVENIQDGMKKLSQILHSNDNNMKDI